MKRRWKRVPAGRACASYGWRKKPKRLRRKAGPDESGGLLPVAVPPPKKPAKRILYGAYVGAQPKRRVCDLKDGKDKVVVEGVIVMITERNAFQNKKKKGRAELPAGHFRFGWNGHDLLLASL